MSSGAPAALPISSYLKANLLVSGACGAGLLRPPTGSMLRMIMNCRVAGDDTAGHELRSTRRSSDLVVFEGKFVGERRLRRRIVAAADRFHVAHDHELPRRRERHGSS